MKKKTAMQSLIDKLNSINPTEFCSIETIKQWCEEEKKNERWQIKHAWCGGYISTDEEDAESFFNEHYKYE